MVAFFGMKAWHGLFASRLFRLSFLDALFSVFARFFEAIGLSGDGYDLAVVEESVDHGDDTGGVWEHLRPFFEAAVCGDDGAFCLITWRDQSEQQIGVATGV